MNKSVPESLDVSEYKTAAGAAKATYKTLVEWAEFYGINSDEIELYSPENNPRGNNWGISWESGPSEWAVSLTGGEWMGWSTFGGDAEPCITGLTNGEFLVECYYSFDLQFMNIKS